MAKRLGWNENGVSDVGFPYPVLIIEYVSGGGKGYLRGWLPISLVGAAFTRFVSRALAYSHKITI
jgi:hypothetical protein